MVLFFLNFFFTVRSWSFTGTDYAPKTCEIDAKSPTIVFSAVEADIALELGNGDLQAMEKACAGKPDEAACAKAFEATLEAAARMS